MLTKILKWFQKSPIQVLIDTLIKKTKSGELRWDTRFTSQGHTHLCINVASMDGVNFDVTAGGNPNGWAVTLYVDGVEIDGSARLFGCPTYKLYKVIEQTRESNIISAKEEFAYQALDKIRGEQCKNS